MYKPMLLFAPLVVAALIPSTPLAPLPAETAPIDFFPKDTLAFAELHGTDTWLNRARLDVLVEAALAEGLLDTEAETQLRGALDFARLFAGSDPVDLAGKLTAGGLAAGLIKSEKNAAWGLVLESASEATLDAALAKAFAFLEGELDAHGLLDAPHGNYRGADYWKLGDKLAIGRSGATLALAGSTDALQVLIDEAADDKPGLAGRADFTASSSNELELWFDRAGTSAYAAELGEEAKKLTAFVNAAHLPQVQFLLGPGLADLGSSKTISAGLDLDATGLGLSITGHAPESHTGLEPTAGPPARLLDGSASLASGMVYRDVASIVNRASELFAPEMQPKFSKALGDLALLFGGMELDEELLPGIAPWIEFTVRNMDFADAPRPALELPGGAVVLTVEPRLKDTLVAGFQTTIGIANTDRAQAGEPAYTLGLDLEGEVLITSGHMPRPESDDAVDNSYNVAPSAAYVDGDGVGYFVIGSHEAIVRDVVRHLAALDSPASAERVRESVRLTAAPLAKLIQDSTDYLAMQAVLEEGKTFEEATQELEMLTRIVELFDSGTLHVDYPEDGDINISVELELAHVLFTDSKATNEGL